MDANKDTSNESPNSDLNANKNTSYKPFKNELNANNYISDEPTRNDLNTNKDSIITQIKIIQRELTKALVLRVRL